MTNISVMDVFLLFLLSVHIQMMSGQHVASACYNLQTQRCTVSVLEVNKEKLVLVLALFEMLNY